MGETPARSGAGACCSSGWRLYPWLSNFRLPPPDAIDIVVSTYLSNFRSSLTP